MDDAFRAGDEFLLRQGRLLERRLFAACFLGAPAAAVTAALRGYQNDDGGFGQALEPDLRCPASLPVFTETALAAMAAAGAADPDLTGRACDYLAGVADRAGAGGAVPPAVTVIEDFPRAAHWTDWTYQPALNPTAGLAGLLYRLHCDHPWREAAARWCWQQLESGRVPGDAHALSEVMIFLEYVPDAERAQRCAEELAGHFAAIPMFQLDPDATGYGLTPLAIAPAADSRWRALFGAGVIGAHLDKLAAAQQDDGGWPISWEPPSEAAALEWRGIVTLQALRTLTSYGRLDAGGGPAR